MVKSQASYAAEKLAFVDIETSGGNFKSDRIIEIAILRVEKGKLVEKFESLIDPECPLPPEIIRMTGISKGMLDVSPNFRSLSDKIYALLEDCTFVAHNVGFDFSFIKNEFKKLGLQFNPKQFCTVKLSRFLYPEHIKHNLDMVILRNNLIIENRHRAYGDAKAIYDFFNISVAKFGEETISKAFDTYKRSAIPTNIDPITIKTLPESPGVYIFYGENNAPLYVGKSTNIKKRVMSHFSSYHSSPMELKISQQVKDIGFYETSGELGALLKESQIIKEMQPLYNRKLRNSLKLNVLKKITNSHAFDTVVIEHLSEISQEELPNVLGVFKSKKDLKNYLIDICKHYELCEKLLGLEKTDGECFGYRLGKCKGACAQEESAMKYNLRFQEAFSKSRIKRWPFEGAILISEENGDKSENFVFNNWCYIGTIKTTEQYDDFSFEHDPETFFDHDAYKILSSYLNNPKNIMKVKHFDLQKFNLLIA